MAITLKDVAARAGVSRGTVDRVLYGRGIVNSETREKVLQALEELQYTPNVSARALVRTHRQPKIGVIIPDQQGFFHDEVLRGIREGTRECNAVGIAVEVRECDANDPGGYLRIIDELCEAGIGALALSGQDCAPLIRAIDDLAEQDIPVITINSDIPDSRRRSFVGEDSYKSGRIAGEMMAKMISRPGSILVLGGRREYSAHVNRVRGFQDALREHAITELNSITVYTYEDNELTSRRTAEILQSEATLRGVYLATSSVSAYVETRCRFGGEHLITISHDIPPRTLDYLRSGDIDLTIEQNIYRQGFKPLQMLRDYLLTGKPIPQEEIRTFYNVISAECL
ncbi:MAG: substrate-binding domain-containing protein [Firmicutes bacterium]|nr:substrate-binding domain-containing protein [Bacillota bacterium]